jgi:IS30 family transposase
MNYLQVTEKERYYISFALAQGVPKVTIARELGRSRSTIQREIKRNQERNGFYKPFIAHEIAVYRRRSSRQKSYFTELEWGFVYEGVREKWAPEQVATRLGREGLIKMHYGTIYREIKRDKRRGGTLFSHLRQASKKRRKRNGRPDSRGRLRGKRCITQRPKVATLRLEKGHWEVDLMRGFRAQGWILTAIDRKTRLVRIRKLSGKSVREVNRKLIPLIKRHQIKTITVDNGCEFHGFKDVERATGARFYFAHAHKSWERGSIENMNGLIRQYLPKSMTFTHLSQARCSYIERKLNGRPRKILDFKTPEECHYGV